MAAPREVAIKNLEKALESPNIGKRGPGQKALDQAEARRIYLEKLSEKFEGIIDIHLAEAAKAPNVIERKEVLHQIVGKPVEKMEVEQTTTLKVDV